MAAALSVGCGAAPQTGATQTAPVSSEASEAAEAAPRPGHVAADDPDAREAEVAPAGEDGPAREDPEAEPECAGQEGEDCASSGERRGARARERGNRRVTDTGHRPERDARERPASEPAAEPQQPAPPVQGELVDRFFFARGSANLDDHGHALDAIAKVVRAGEPVTVQIIGGADEREPPGLARARAHGVRDALLARGVPASWIVIALESPSPGPPSYDQKVDIRLQRP